MLKSSELSSCLQCAYEMESTRNNYAKGSMEWNTEKTVLQNTCIKRPTKQGPKNELQCGGHLS